MVEFVHPGVLFALPLAAVPVIIHLLNRRRYRTVQWAAMMYLVQAEKQTRRRIRWQNVLLLLLRTLAVLLLVLFFAQPVISSSLSGARDAEVVVVLDDSASMGAVSDGRSAWDRARDAAAAVAGEAARGGAPFRLFVGSELEPLLVTDALGAADVEALTSRLAGAGPTAAAFAPAERLDAMVRAGAAGDRPVQTFVITDLQATEWQDDSRAAELAEVLRALRGRGGMTVVDVGGAAGTAGIADIRTDGRIAYAGTPFAFRVVLSGDVSVDGNPAGLRVSLDGMELPPYPLPAVPAGETRDALVEVFVGDPGHHAVELEWDTSGGRKDALASDNRRAFVFEAFERPAALIVGRGVRSRDGAAPELYLHAALEPVRESGPGMRPQIVPYGGSAPEDLAGHAVVFVCDVASPSAWADALSRYVAEGGRLVVFLGEGADPGAWRGTLLGTEGLLPCEVGGAVRRDAPEVSRLTGLDYGHPLLQPFAGWDSLFAMARFSAFRRLEPGDGVHVLARYDDPARTPAILAARHGVGEVVLLNTSPDDAWSDWPRSEGGRVTYVSLMNWLAEQDAALRLRPGVRLNLAAGERLVHMLDPAQFRHQALLEAPSTDISGPGRLRAGPGPGGTGFGFESDPLMVQGIWRLTLTAADESERVVPFAVNLPDAERDLARATPDGLSGVNVVPWEQVADAASAPSRYWPGLAAVLVAVLLVESILAFAFGRPAVAEAQEGRAS